MPAQVNVRYKDREWPVQMGGLDTIQRILMDSLISHGLPVRRHESFSLYHADGRVVADPSGNAIFAGVSDGDTLELRYNG